MITYLVIPVLLLLAAFAILRLWQHNLKLRREREVRSFILPKGLFAKLQAKHPHLDTKQCQLVAQGLRQYFLSYLKSGRQEVAMPSQVVDDLWHEFILYTRNYQFFCEKAFGRFMHHTPAVVLGNVKQSNEGLRRCWRFACMEENIDPRNPSRLPLLFALDKKLGIANGFVYAPDCEPFRRHADGGTNNGIVHCGGDFSRARLMAARMGLVRRVLMRWVVMEGLVMAAAVVAVEAGIDRAWLESAVSPEIGDSLAKA